jgi:hypothetical protein
MAVKSAGSSAYTLAAGPARNAVRGGRTAADYGRARSYLRYRWVWPFPEWERRQRSSRRNYRANLPGVIEATEAWPEGPRRSLRHQLRQTVEETIGWAEKKAAARRRYRLYGTVSALVAFIEEMIFSLIRPDVVGPLAVALTIAASILSTLVILTYLWRSDLLWIHGIATTMGLLASAALVRLPLAATGNYFSSINLRSGVDRIAVVLLMSGVVVGYVVAIGTVMFHPRPGRVEVEILRRAFESLAMLRRARGPVITVATKRQAIRSIECLTEALCSRALLRALRTGNISADAVVFTRIHECSQRLREIQVWVALPRLDTIQLVRKQLMSLIAVVAVGAYDFLPQPRREIPVTSGRARVVLSIVRLLGGIIPIGVLLTFTLLGLRLPELLSVPTYALSILWMFYCLSQALKLDARGFAKFAVDTTSAAKNLSGLTGQAEGDEGAAANKAS